MVENVLWFSDHKWEELGGKTTLFHNNRIYREIYKLSLSLQKTSPNTLFSPQSLLNCILNLSRFFSDDFWSETKALFIAFKMGLGGPTCGRWWMTIKNGCCWPYQFSPFSCILYNYYLKVTPAMSLHSSNFFRVTTFVNMSVGFSFVWIFTSFNSCWSITSRIQW